MRFGVALPHFSRLASREATLSLAREAEALDYDSIWTTDHVLMAADQPEPYGTILAPNDIITLKKLAERITAFAERYSSLGNPFAWTFTRQELERRLSEPALQVDSVPLTMAA